MPRTGPRRSIGSAAALWALAALSLLWAAASHATPSGPISASPRAVLMLSTSATRALASLQLSLSERDGNSLLTLTLSAPVRLRLLRLHQPERIVIDLPRTQRHAALPMRSPESPIAALRAGELRHGALRLVLDVDPSAPLTVNSQPFEGGRDGACSSVAQAAQPRQRAR